MAVPRTTHQWLQPLYDFLSGKGTGFTTLGSSTGVIGLYGATGAARIATGTNSVLGTSSVGNSGILSVANGGTGTYYNENDIVLALKNLGVLKP